MKIFFIGYCNFILILSSTLYFNGFVISLDDWGGYGKAHHDARIQYLQKRYPFLPKDFHIQSFQSGGFQDPFLNISFNLDLEEGRKFLEGLDKKYNVPSNNRSYFSQEGLKNIRPRVSKRIEYKSKIKYLTYDFDFLGYDLDETYHNIAITATEPHTLNRVYSYDPGNRVTSLTPSNEVIKFSTKKEYLAATSRSEKENRHKNKYWIINIRLSTV
ncbi:MAG: hypothetical protein ACJARD_001033 [Alphaproteobacteria bacterium]|jgi:hypothetical protein